MFERERRLADPLQHRRQLSDPSSSFYWQALHLSPLLVSVAAVAAVAAEEFARFLSGVEVVVNHHQ